METNISTYQPQPRSIIYAPWRENYINMVSTTQHTPEESSNKPCVFCHIISNKDNTKNFIVHRGKHSLVMLASQPYIDNGIHFLIIPYQHTREISDLSAKTYKEENDLTQKLCALFSDTCNEIYINTNQGISAGASIPVHHHKHIIINNAARCYNLVQILKKANITIDLQRLYKDIQPLITTLPSIIVPKQSNCPLFNKNCYHCSLIKNYDQDNLIIHRGKNVLAMLAHYPTYCGEIDIIPNDHIESLETMPAETYEEMNYLTTAIYPLLLKILNTQDSNIGILSYGSKAGHTEHIKQKIIPRKSSWNTTPITDAHHVSANIKRLYRKLLEAWHISLLINEHKQQSSKL
jgi:ATP adenylyltransferase